MLFRSFAAASAVSFARFSRPGFAFSAAASAAFASASPRVATDFIPLAAFAASRAEASVFPAASEPFAAGLAALYAYESQQPEVMRVKREGLAECYGVTTGHDYFVEHETADVRHSAQEAELVERYADGSEEAVVAGAQVGLDAIYTLLDGVYDQIGRAHV